jgi:hypothetical protein
MTKNMCCVGVLLKQKYYYQYIIIIIIFSDTADQRGLWPPRHTRFSDHTKRRATVGSTPLDEVIISTYRRIYLLFYFCGARAKLGPWSPRY